MNWYEFGLSMTMEIGSQKSLSTKLKVVSAKVFKLRVILVKRVRAINM